MRGAYYCSEEREHTPAPEQCVSGGHWVSKFLAKTPSERGSLAGAAGISKRYGDGETGRTGVSFDVLISGAHHHSAKRVRKRRDAVFFFIVFCFSVISPVPCFHVLFRFVIIISSSVVTGSLVPLLLSSPLPLRFSSFLLFLSFLFCFSFSFTLYFPLSFFKSRSRNHKGNRSNTTICLHLLLMITKWNISAKG